MTEKRNRWLVGTVLILAMAAFLSLSLLPILSGSQGRRPANPSPAVDPTAQKGELEAQAKGYELVLGREPTNQTALKGLIETRLKLGDIKGILEPLQTLVEQNPKVSEYQVLLAQTKQRLGDLEGAAQAYRQVLDGNSADLNALQGLTALLMEQKRPQAAIGLLKDTLATAAKTQGGAKPQGDGSPGTVDTLSVRLLLAQVYAETKQFDQALGLYDEAIAASPNNFRPILAKALVLKEKGDLGAAQPLFDQAVTMAPAQFKDQIKQMAAQETGPGTSPTPAPAK
ncbi:MAG: tetratricopeptide repeat protein [Cyanobacteria bacterium REEB459]|nr:tetratricopeptide repeat protein [Cyanobacteria bacterium REEB459]